MPQCPDNIVLADKVMFLLRTKYSGWESKDLPFDAAFMELMDKFNVPGDERYPKKQEIGKILSARKQVKAKKGDANIRAEKPKVNFAVEAKSRKEIILMSPMMGDTITLRRDKFGKAVWHAYKGNHTQLVLAQAVERADEIFAELDEEARAASEVCVDSKSHSEIIMTLGGKYRALITRGIGTGLRAMVFLGTEEVLHKDVPGGLVAEAKAIARAYFRDTHTGDLFSPCCE